MSFFKRFFGGGDKAPPPPAASENYKGYTIDATPLARNGQFQTAGEIRADSGDDERVHSFVRADAHPNAEQAAEHALQKGRQIIDERGDRVLDSAR